MAPRVAGGVESRGIARGIAGPKGTMLTSDLRVDQRGKQQEREEREERGKRRKTRGNGPQSGRNGATGVHRPQKKTGRAARIRPAARRISGAGPVSGGELTCGADPLPPVVPGVRILLPHAYPSSAAQSGSPHRNPGGGAPACPGDRQGPCSRRGPRAAERAPASRRDPSAATDGGRRQAGGRTGRPAAPRVNAPSAAPACRRPC